MAAQLLTGIIATLVTAALLDSGFLLTPLILNFPIGLLCLATLTIIPADTSSKSLPNHGDEQDDDHPKTFSSFRRSVRILSQVLRDRNVLVLLATVPVAKASNPVLELMYQYVPKRFGLSFPTVSLHLPRLSAIAFSYSNSCLG